MLLSCIALVSFASIQVPAPTEADFVGFWRGTLWCNGAGQAFEVELSPAEGGLTVQTTLPDWIFFPVDDATARVVDGQIELPLVYGTATLQIDRERGEMRGSFGASPTRIEVHAKRAIQTPALRVNERDVRITSGDIELAATCFEPGWPGPHPALVWIPSRGPIIRSEDLIGRGRWLARLGIASVVWDKRGTGESGGDLRAATFDDLVGDARSVLRWLASQDAIDPEQLGLHASSAGGWAAIRLAALHDPPVDFVVTYLAPTTSVRTQQSESWTSTLRAKGYGDRAIQNALEWNALLFEAQPTDAEWERYGELLDAARSDGWVEFLDFDDDPATREAFPTAWVRRHDYDPAADWASLRTPWLGLLGERDTIVPATTNRLRLEERPAERSVLVVPGIEHGFGEWPLELRRPGDSAIDSYLVWNKLPVEIWEPTVRWIWSQTRLSPFTPFDVR